MAHENEQARQDARSIGQPNASNIITIVDEPEENTIIYSWRDGQLKRLPYEEHEARTGQKIKTFLSFREIEKVIVIKINREDMCLSVTNGIIEGNKLKYAENPSRYYASSAENEKREKCLHRVPTNNPVLFFSLNPGNFGEEIKGRVAREVEDRDEKVYILEGDVCTVGTNGNYGMWGKGKVSANED